MTNLLKGKRDGSGFSRTPGENRNLKATREGSSVQVDSNYDDGNMPDCSYRKPTCRVSLNKKSKKSKKKGRKRMLNIGTWNVQTMLELGKLHLLCQEIDRLKMDITGLCETRWSGEGRFKIGDKTTFFSGNEKGGYNGVALMLNNKLADSVTEFNPISDRIISLKIETKPVTLNIVQVYAPASSRPLEEADAFYNDLQSVREHFPKRETCIIMGDFNACVGEGIDKECGIGSYGLGKRNERGDMLANFCQANDMIVTNTIFQQPLRRRWTWLSPDGNTRNQIDYILVDKEWVTTIQNSKARPGADCDSDHNLVAAKVKLKAYKILKPKMIQRFALDNLLDENTALDYNLETSNRFEKLTEEWIINDAYPDEIWNEMKNVYLETAETIIGKKKTKKSKPYISEEVIKMAEEKSLARKNGKREEYVKLKRNIKAMVRRDRNLWLEEECAKINECNERFKSKELFDKIKKVKKQNFKAKGIVIKDKSGKVLTKENEILNRWKEYGSTLFESSGEKLNFSVEQYEKEPEPLLDEVWAAFKQLKQGKSPGLDNIPAELIRHSGYGGRKAMHHLCCKIWHTTIWPKDWKLQEFVVLYKSGDIKECNNYRTIALLSHASKILLIIILNRMKSKVEQELSDCQAGYRKNRGTTDMLFVLQNIIEKVNNTDLETFITFIDYSKAFDSVIHNTLFETMCVLGFPKHLVLLISTLYTNQQATIRWDGQNTEFFNIEKGVRQGCILSPHLFSLYTEQVMRDADIEGLGLTIGGRNITDLRYADDTALVSDNPTSMRRIVHKVDMAGRKAGLKLNAKKTKVMHIKRNNREKHTFKVDNLPLENVEHFKYLGSIKSHNSSCSKDISARIGMTKNRMLQLTNIWKSHNIPISLKIKLLECLVWPVLLYGSEAWAQKKTDDTKIEACEMWLYRRMLRISWTEKRTNDSILEALKVPRKMLKLINRRKLKYIGHASRNQSTNLMTIAYQGKLDGRNCKGRPAVSVIENVKKASGLKLQEVSWKSQNRESWRRFVMDITTSNFESGEDDR